MNEDFRLEYFVNRDPKCDLSGPLIFFERCILPGLHRQIYESVHKLVHTFTSLIYNTARNYLILFKVSNWPAKYLPFNPLKKDTGTENEERQIR